MKVKTLLQTLLVCTSVSIAAVSSPAFAEANVVGSGASFPFPIYSKWFKDFSKMHDARVDYQAKGSGAGIQDFLNHTVDFAASDAAMKDKEMMQVEGGAVLLPMTAGEVVLAYNLKGVKSLKLPRDVYPAIFLGKVTKWNDPRIVSANPGVKLPDEDITVVTRSDSSGTSYVFTKHLSAISPEFDTMVGTAKSPQWPSSSKLIKAPKNDGVTATIKQTPGAIGYIEYGYAKLTGTPTAMLQNKSGKYMAPGAESGAAALASAEFSEGNLPNSDAPNLIAWVSDPSGADSYPIASFTWMLFYREQDDDKAATLRAMVEYCLDHGQQIADSMGYIPLPENVIAKVREASKLIQ